MSLFRTSLLLAVALILPGCTPKPAAPPEKSAGNAAASPRSNEQSAVATSDDVLTSAVYQLRPENFGINAATDKPVSLLNSWRFKQVEAKAIEDAPVPVTVPTGWMTPDDEARLAQTKFDTPDAVHVRDALFHRAIAGYLSDRAQGELQRVEIVVDFVCRNIALWKDDEIELPLMPYITMQLGRGSADDRAWIVSEILRQLRIDSIILRPKSDTKGTSDQWLQGVLIDGQVYLFDMRLGLSVANGSTSSTATLADIKAHPEWLEQMSANEPYRLTAADLAKLDVYVISDPNTWCRRMHYLEQSLPSSDICILYDPLTDEDGKAGLLQRVSKGGNWPQEELKLWPYPRRQLEDSKRPSPERDQEFQRLTAPFTVPIPFKVDDNGKAEFGAPERKLQRARTDHLLGKFADATTKYLRIRRLDVEQSPPEIERLNRMASEDALYWTILCKFELGEYSTAVDLLADYLRKYDRKGKWFFPARSLLAQCHARLNQPSDAISTLERTSSDDPYRVANAVRVKRWAAASQNK